MTAKFDRYREDLTRLIKEGERLDSSMQLTCFPSIIDDIEDPKEKEELKKIKKALPDFETSYQAWYSEVKALIKQLLPDRLEDLIRHYQKPKPRKDISCENYRIEDYLQDLVVTSTDYRGQEETIVGKEAAIPHFRQQRAILAAVEKRFESTLYDIQQMVQGDLFDSDLDAAKELLKNKFIRASGAICGVVLEKHLKLVCDTHSVSLGRKKGTIGNLNYALKAAGVIDTPQWRFIHHLGDIRNLCDHDNDEEPTKEQVSDLNQGVSKITKTLF